MKIIPIAAALAFAMTSTVATAAPCRNAHGKFIKCADKPAAKGTKCKDAKGKFAKCGTPGATPI